jgi:mRNA interferase RelE/StbE
MSNKYLLLIDKSVIKDLQKLPAKQYKQVVSKLLSLSFQPCQQDCKALKGIPGGYRVDQGEFRILFYVQETADELFLGQVQVFRVGKRNDDEVYQNL